MARSRNQAPRRYPRTARINELLREILGDALERLDDDRLQLVTVTAVNCDPDLRHAKVYLDTLGGPEEDEALLEALAELRPRLQAAIATQARLKRTPELSFVPDPVVRSADRIEDVLRGLEPE
jgi:ribosome-binding factor A